MKKISFKNYVHHMTKYVWLIQKNTSHTTFFVTPWCDFMTFFFYLLCCIKFTVNWPLRYRGNIPLFIIGRVRFRAPPISNMSDEMPRFDCVVRINATYKGKRRRCVSNIYRILVDFREGEKAMRKRLCYLTV